MKTHIGIKLLTYVYFLFCILGAAFYIFADFGKAITNLVGILWLVFSVVAIIFIRKPPIFLSLIAIMTIMQIPIIYDWFFWRGAAIFFFSLHMTVGIYGAIFHIFLLLTGIAIFIYHFFKRKSAE